MNQGFKGTVIGVSRVEVTGGATNAALSFDVQFMSEDGDVHAHTKHRYELSDEPNLARVLAATQELFEAVIELAANTHFTEPGTAVLTVQKVMDGIAESLADRSADGFERQG